MRLMAGLTDARFPFLSRLSAKARHELGALSARKVARASRLLERGDAAGGAYLVVGGALRVFYITSEGGEATLYRVEPGGTCVLALTATLAAEPYPAWVEAGKQGAEFVRVPSRLFHQLLDGEDGFRQFVFAALSARIFDLMQTLEETGSARVEQRLVRYLLRHADAAGWVRMTQAAIAAEPGTAREVVFRALRSLAERGLVQTARMRIRVIDAQALRTVAGSNGS
jgi:CRP/FNR family transcriptional regulator, anaerobic regulatory protein